jgi:hypothetical protein
MRYQLLLGVLLMVKIASSAAMDLNAPVNTTPTVGTEIKRGVDAANACDTSAMEPLNYALCIQGIDDRNAQKVVDSKPFDVGLYFAAWLSMDIIGSMPASNDFARHLGEAGHSEAASMYIIYRDFQRKLGVTDDDVITASWKNKDAVEARLAVWANQPSPSPINAAGQAFKTDNSIAQQDQASPQNISAIAPKAVLGVMAANKSELPPAAASALGDKQLRGVLVVAVTPGSVADKAGMKVADDFYEFDGKAVSSGAEMKAAIAAVAPGSSVSVKVMRNGAPLSLNAEFRSSEECRVPIGGKDPGFSAALAECIPCLLATAIRMMDQCSRRRCVTAMWSAARISATRRAVPSCSFRDATNTVAFSSIRLVLRLARPPVLSDTGLRVTQL